MPLEKILMDICW